MAFLARPVIFSPTAVWIVPKVFYEVDGVPISIYEDRKTFQTYPRC